METVEILAGGHFANALIALGLSGQCTYRYTPPEKSYREEYQIWELPKDDFEALCEVSDDDWKEDWGWWRSALGSNMGSVDREFVIHGEKVMAWDGYRRISWQEECTECSDYKEGLCSASDEDVNECFQPRAYDDVLSYFCDELGASQPRNVCALAVDLARQNGMTMAELFKKCLG